NTRSKIQIETESKGKNNGGDSEPSKSKGDDKPRKPRTPSVRKFEQIECPLCGQGTLIKGNTAFGCSRYREGCTLRLNFSEYPETLTPAKLKKLLATKKKK
ncbi:MAG: hypothetical protein K2H27_02030, partial [Duncaniella sp.]|nr:hypothetical protein [Duncaniella sp.]